MNVLRPICALALAATGFGQTQPIQSQPSPAPGFIAYQALFINVVWLEKQATQADSALGPGNQSSATLLRIPPSTVRP